MEKLQEQLKETKDRLNQAEVRLIHAEHDLIRFQRDFSNSLGAFNKVMDDETWNRYMGDYHLLHSNYKAALFSVENLKAEVQQIEDQIEACAL